ncbi:MAG: DUF4339 domain-containing protein [Bryobacteraceae bacterium]
MQYHISRGGETYGPYPEEMVREMLREGRVAPPDLCWAEDMQGWLPVNVVFGTETATAQEAASAEVREEAPREAPEEGSPSASPSAAGEEHPAWEIPVAPAGESAPSPPLPVVVPEAWRRAKERREAPAAPPRAGLSPGLSIWPAPPDLHWGLVLGLTYVTFGLFAPVWFLVQYSFVKKLDPKNPAGKPILGSIATVLASHFAALFGGGMLAELISPLLFWAGIAQWMWAALLIRRSLLVHYNAVEKIASRLNPAFACVFGAFYFQYHFSRTAKWQKTGRMG